MTSFSGGNTTQFPWPVPFPRQRKAALESCVRFATTLSRLNQARNKYYGGITKRMNFNCPRRWNQWKHWAKCQQPEAKCGRLHLFLDLLAWNVANKLLPFTRWSWIGSNSFPRQFSPQRRTGKLRKLSFLWKISLPSGGILVDIAK